MLVIHSILAGVVLDLQNSDFCFEFSEAYRTLRILWQSILPKHFSKLINSPNKPLCDEGSNRLLSWIAK